MFWYELASPSEVTETLSQYYRSYWDNKTEFKGCECHGESEYAHKVNFCIAEQLWGDKA